MKLNEIKLINPYLQLPQECHNRVKSSPLVKPFLIHTNKAVVKMLNIDTQKLATEAFVNFVNGTLSLQGSDTFAMCYAEHPEFERWAGVTPDVFKNKKLSCSS